MLFQLCFRYFAGLVISCLAIMFPASLPAAGFCPDAAVNSPKALWQTLPVTARAEIRGKAIELEVARTEEERARGLMYRPCLPENRGMIFVYDHPEQVNFWMKDVLIPLDIIFLSHGKIKTIYRNLLPCHAENCPDYVSKSEIDQVLELNAGMSDKLLLKENDVIVIRFHAR